jgi:hypothetical protein
MPAFQRKIEIPILREIKYMRLVTMVGRYYHAVLLEPVVQNFSGC